MIYNQLSFLPIRKISAMANLCWLFSGWTAWRGGFFFLQFPRFWVVMTAVDWGGFASVR